ncbi:hypothetical protein GCM10011571_15450 [Marinithermofilum abyssi]|uniref:Uncharacterized protein n=1 Tax=Marinithermofilum abyssi TaxID=1571185 RepID=A0A8J2YAJ3_9BACL|nr:hypothetical protein [Marinithermofilum abyssi]GGE14839.1 hypothetical protein GCM10011571_15450 [Marinithermofilum abyssi]
MVSVLFLRWFVCLLAAWSLWIPVQKAEAHDFPPVWGKEKTVAPMIGDYAGEIREPKPRADGLHHVDTPRLIEKLQQLGVNTYFYLIWHQSSDWDDLRKEFLPAAKKAGIDVWIYLVPPTEAREKQSEPYGTDYIAWFRATAKLSLAFPNLKGVVMDDFNHNLRFFTPEYVKRMKRAGAEINPRLRFYPQIYYTAIGPSLLKQYRHVIDGVVMTFRDGKFRNTQRAHYLPQQIEKVHRLLHEHHLPFILMVHASKLSATPANPSADYVKTALQTGIHYLQEGKLDGLVTYVLNKEWFPEDRDRQAFSGNGFGCLFVPPGYNPSVGGKGELTQTIHVTGKGPYRLRFYHLSVYPRYLVAGQYVKQVLVNRRVVWQQDVTVHPAERWQQQTIDLTPYLSGKKEATLTLRLYRLNGGSHAWLYTGFDQLQISEVSISNPDFETKEAWQITANHPSMIGQRIQYDSQRRFKVYVTTMQLYTAYHLYHQCQSPEVSAEMIRLADEMLDAMSKGHKKQALLAMEQMMAASQRKNIAEETKASLHRSIKKLHHLLML